MNRQFEWKKTLERYGCAVNLERSISIRGAKIVVDIVAEIENKTFFIEIGDIEERKKALMSLYADNNPNIIFIHEPYEFNGMSSVLEQLDSYLNSPEYGKILEEKKRIEERRLEERRKEEEIFRERRRKKEQKAKRIDFVKKTFGIFFLLWFLVGLVTFAILPFILTSFFYFIAILILIGIVVFFVILTGGF